MRLIKNIKNKILLHVGMQIHRMNHTIAQATLPKFSNNPHKLTISLPRRIINPERIFIGDKVSLGPGSFLYAVTHYPTDVMRHPQKKQDVQTFDSMIVIGNNVTATADLQIAAASRVTIEDDVMFASNIHINDSYHGYNTAEEPYKYQPLVKIAPIVIKQGCWIGQNVVIVSGVTIGEHTIIGANSVVTETIPAKCIAVGTPARVVKTWNKSRQQWVRADKKNGKEKRS
jgi:acetyltransferase-like isoleucine patch superfamily enzyme